MKYEHTVGKNTLVCKMEMFAFVAITFEPIGILTHSAHQNDRLNLSFVKDKHTGSQKMARNGSKTAIYFVIFISKQSLCRFFFSKIFLSTLSHSCDWSLSVVSF